MIKEARRWLSVSFALLTGLILAGQSVDAFASDGQGFLRLAQQVEAAYDTASAAAGTSEVEEAPDPEVSDQDIRAAGKPIGLLGEGEGYVILAVVSTGSTPESLKLEERAFFGNSHTFRDLADGENIDLVRLPAGEYHWTRADLIGHVYVTFKGERREISSPRYHFDLDDGRFTLTVREGVINYGGHLLVDLSSGTGYIHYVNRTSQALNALERCCNALLEKYPFVVPASYEDPFLQFYRKLVVGGAE